MTHREEELFSMYEAIYYEHAEKYPHLTLGQFMSSFQEWVSREGYDFLYIDDLLFMNLLFRYSFKMKKVRTGANLNSG